MKISRKILSAVIIIGVLFNFTMLIYAESVNNNSSPQLGKKAIIIVPGIGGSELFSAKNQRINGVNYEQGYRFWPPDCITPFLDGKQKLSTEDFNNVKIDTIANNIKLICCKSTGESKIGMMPSNPILDCRNNTEKRNFGIVNCYKKLVKTIVKCTDPNEYDVVFFSYDWRQGNTSSAVELERLINEQNYKNVILVGHSMGCLVCSSYLTNKENKAKVEKGIFMGAPLLGAPKAFSVIAEGKFIDGLLGELLAPIINPLLKDITRNCKSLYELLPPKQYFDIMQRGYLKLCDKQGNIKEINNYGDTVNVIRYEIGGKCVNEFLESAQRFYDTLFNDNQFVLYDENLKVYNILGINQFTPGEIVINAQSDNKELKTNGDGMVTIESALVGNTLSNKVNYYLKGVSHMGLMSNRLCMKLIRDILNNKDNRPVLKQ